MSAGDWKEMYAAAQAGDLALVRHHLQAGVNPDYQHPEVMCTPLVASILAGHAEVARCLLEQGASPHLRSEMDQLTPLEAALRQGSEDLVARLQGLGARVSAVRPPFWWRWLPV